MNGDCKEISCDLMIIGCGLAGMSAALFAARSGIDAVQVGMTSQFGFASGMLDILGVHPAAEGRVLEDPWQGIEQLRSDEPQHPYCRLETRVIREAVGIFVEFLGRHGIPYATGSERNLSVMTPAGTIKTTYAVPRSMVGGAIALAEKAPCLLVEFKRLRGFSVKQMAMTLADPWPGLRTLSVEFPDAKPGERYAEQMARALDSAECRNALIDAIRPHLRDARFVGLPAVLGMNRNLQVMTEMHDGLGVPVFEIPTMLPAVPGLRLQALFETILPSMGVRNLLNRRVLEVVEQSDGRWVLDMDNDPADQRVIARSVLLCSGRFLGKGLHADRLGGIRETIFGLPVSQPRDRTDWHNRDFLHPAGHPINRAGLMVDGFFRPVDETGRVLYPNLWAAGSILAYQDWMRQKCGSGLAIATAYGAVQACAAFLK
jgi:glycerol-3-phosphate dehydrogenase subunit B